MEFILYLVMLLGILLFLISIVILLIRLIRRKSKRIAFIMLLISILFTFGGLFGVALNDFMSNENVSTNMNSEMQSQDELTEAEETVLSYAQTLKDSLADRNSFDLRSVRYYEGIGGNIAVLEIGGSNSFGGMVTATYYFSYSSSVLFTYESTNPMVDELEDFLWEHQDDIIEINCKKIMEHLA